MGTRRGVGGTGRVAADGHRRSRGARRLAVLAAVTGGVAAYRKQRLDAADAAFPEASTPR
ncbi:MAG: hypothetical protein AVDCRST_MAG20-442 [uncultured Acidimicrobiales bacterium]|uniref:Uncharacterized protein n=1 Tax=uncultured Acidimicrobiales bacterium TaxID=310071 RepID=A0A6J4HA64_9ACTN|nr:MAG: hypothetical protein AVDCRST_MAG20-442 [uncultured Acidimicrobiales bacterium]